VPVTQVKAEAVVELARPDAGLLLVAEISARRPTSTALNHSIL
jgi:hypothetical protein